MQVDGVDGTVTVDEGGVRFDFSKAAARRKKSTTISFPYDRIEAVDYRAAEGRWGLDRLLILGRGYSGSDSPASTATFVFGRAADGQELTDAITARIGGTPAASEVLEQRAADADAPKGFRAKFSAFNAAVVEAAEQQRVSGSFAGVRLDGAVLKWSEGGKPRHEDVSGARADVAVGADAQRRITATRIVLIGVFALAFRKQKGTGYLTIEHPDFYLGVPFPIKQERDARAFAAKVNAAARR